MRRLQDPRKKDFSPTILNFGPVEIVLARHFGFCYGVENAIDISYKAIEENPGKRIFLLSQMIHNQIVNRDLEEKGIRFIMDTAGNMLCEWAELRKDDIVIIPAFGTTIEIEKKLQEMGVDVQQYNTTCPFVEKVWKRSSRLGEDGYTIIIHGKHNHEETRATFSHARADGPSFVIRDMEEARMLGEIILGDRAEADLKNIFEGRYSTGFSMGDFERVGVVNQTTMLASETQEIADYFKSVMRQKYGEENLKSHFADTRDTLCYATNDNQQATFGLLEKPADLALVIGGYNSSNTSHIAELCEQKLPTFFINSADAILSDREIQHYDYHQKLLKKSLDYLPAKKALRIIVTSGASCPDSLVEEVIYKVCSFFPDAQTVDQVMADLRL